MCKKYLGSVKDLLVWHSPKQPQPKERFGNGQADNHRQPQRVFVARSVHAGNPGWL